MTWDPFDDDKENHSRKRTAIQYDSEDDENDIDFDDIGAKNIQLEDLVDVEYQGGWREGVVIEIDRDDRNKCLVRLLFEDERDAFWVDLLNYNQVCRYGTHCFVHRTSLMKAGQIIDVMDVHPARMEFTIGRIVGVDGNRMAKVLFLEDNISNKIEYVQSRLIGPYGSRRFGENHEDNILRYTYLKELDPSTRQLVLSESRTYKQERNINNRCRGDDGENRFDGKRKRRLRGINAIGDPRYQLYKNALISQGLSLVEMEGDGNCLFRAVSHQIYGTPDHHKIVRKSCMDYMESERNYFEPFIVTKFEDYIEHKRKDGVWGDDIEIQAMCEIYDRPAQVMAFDPRDGARQLRTFHENDDGRNRPPMRLSFYGGGHYDSIVSETFNDYLLSGSRGDLGSLEESRIALSRARRGGETSEAELISSLSTNEITEQQMLDDAIATSRQQYMGSNNDLETVLEQSLKQIEQDENALIQGVVNESAAAYEENWAIQDSDIAATEREELQKVLELSQQDDDLQQALRLSELNEIERAMELSKQHETSSFDYYEHNEDEEEIQRAIQASLLNQ